VKSERRVTAAGRKLRALLNQTGESLTSFCRRHASLRKHRIAVLRIINGDRYRLIPADTVIRLRKAMREEGMDLPVEAFGSDTARKLAG